MNIKNITIKEAAKILGKSEMFVRIGLQRGLLPIGVVVKTNTKYTYHISPKLLEEYIGNDLIYELCTINEEKYKIE